MWNAVCYKLIQVVGYKVFFFSFFFSWHDQVEITEKEGTCALVRAATEAPLLHWDCSSTFPLRTWTVSNAEITKRLQDPATVRCTFSVVEWRGASSHSWKGNKMRMNLQPGIKDKRKINGRLGQFQLACM